VQYPPSKDAMEIQLRLIARKLSQPSISTGSFPQESAVNCYHHFHTTSSGVLQDWAGEEFMAQPDLDAAVLPTAYIPRLWLLVSQRGERPR